VNVVTVRFFAAARAAVGVSTSEVGAAALGEALRSFDQPVLARCSYLVNGIAVTDLAHPLADGDVVDVLPPFAGG
jgi:molybdopterin synthase sulfur carrier subunit